MYKLIGCLCLVLCLCGCSANNSYNENKETEKMDDSQQDELITSNSSIELDVNRDYNSFGGSINTASMEMADGERKYAIITEVTPVEVVDNSASIVSVHTVSFFNDAELLIADNTISFLLYYNHGFVSFTLDTENSKYIHSIQHKNGEEAINEITFNIDNIEKDVPQIYRLICIPRYPYYTKDVYGEYSPFETPSRPISDEFYVASDEKINNELKVLESDTNCEIEECSEPIQSEIGKVIKEGNYSEFGLSSNDEFIMKLEGDKYKYVAFRCYDANEFTETMRYSTILICDDEVYPGFSNKAVLNYSIDRPSCITKEIDLSNLEEGSHILYTVTVDEVTGRVYRSRYTDIVIE